MRARVLITAVVAMLLALPASAATCIRGPYLQNAASGSILVRWELDVIGPSAVEFGPAAGGDTRIARSEFGGRKHRVTLTQLQPGERYRYRVLSRDEPATAEFEFRATPLDDSKFTFAVWGDSGTGGRTQRQVAELLANSEAEMALVCGDIIYGRGEEEHYDLKFFEPYKNTLPRLNFWPALGNHDVGEKDGAALLAVFDVPANGPRGIQTGRNYSFDHGNAHIAAIDSTASAGALREQIGPWLVSDMAASDKPWKFVFFHHPPYSSANHGENAKMRDTMVTFFQQAKIDIAFGGHDHSYERTHVMGGVLYIVSGNGGNSLYRHENPHDYSAKFYNEKHGLTLVTIEGGKLLLRHVNVDGEEIDRYEMAK